MMKLVAGECLHGVVGSDRYHEKGKRFTDDTRTVLKLSGVLDLVLRNKIKRLL